MSPHEPAPAPEDGRKAPLGHRLLWFAALWLAGVIGLAVIAFGLRALIVPA